MTTSSKVDLVLNIVTKFYIRSCPPVKSWVCPWHVTKLKDEIVLTNIIGIVG